MHGQVYIFNLIVSFEINLSRLDTSGGSDTQIHHVRDIHLVTIASSDGILLAVLRRLGLVHKCLGVKDNASMLTHAHAAVTMIEFRCLSFFV